MCSIHIYRLCVTFQGVICHACRTGIQKFKSWSASQFLEYFCKESCLYVGFEVLTAVVMNSIIFRDMTPCSPLSFNRRFGGTHRLHLNGILLAICLLAGLLNLFLRPWRRRRYVPPKRRLKLHGVIPQNMILFNLVYTSSWLHFKIEWPFLLQP
jgi:hypothetical protein